MISDDGVSDLGALRVGVGNGQINSLGWSVLMPMAGNGGGDVNGNNIWCFGGETETNNGHG